MKCAPAVGRVMQNLVGHDEVEGLAAERRVEDVALHVVEVVALGAERPPRADDGFAEVHAHDLCGGDVRQPGGLDPRAGAGVDHPACAVEHPREVFLVGEAEPLLEPAVLEHREGVTLLIGDRLPLGAERGPGVGLLVGALKLRGHARHSVADRDVRPSAASSTPSSRSPLLDGLSPIDSVDLVAGAGEDVKYGRLHQSELIRASDEDVRAVPARAPALRRRGGRLFLTVAHSLLEQCQSLSKNLRLVRQPRDRRREVQQ